MQQERRRFVERPLRPPETPESSIEKRDGS